MSSIVQSAHSGKDVSYFIGCMASICVWSENKKTKKKVVTGCLCYLSLASSCSFKLVDIHGSALPTYPSNARQNLKKTVEVTPLITYINTEKNHHCSFTLTWAQKLICTYCWKHKCRCISHYPGWLALFNKLKYIVANKYKYCTVVEDILLLKKAHCTNWKTLPCKVVPLLIPVVHRSFMMKSSSVMANTLFVLGGGGWQFLLWYLVFWNISWSKGFYWITYM